MVVSIDLMMTSRICYLFLSSSPPLRQRTAIYAPHSATQNTGECKIAVEFGSGPINVTRQIGFILESVND